jgi:S1-C subfamily serine protease
MQNLLRAALVFGAAILLAAQPARAQTPTFDEIKSAVVRIQTHINPDGTTVENLGRNREGSGILLDQSGLVLTIGYLMVEAYAAEVVTSDGRTVPADIVGYDQDTGFGLIRTIEPLKAKPLAIGKSDTVKENDPVLVAGADGAVIPARVVSRREFAGSWEYLIDDAIFTSPPHPAWSGSALVNREGKLVGVGSLIVNDASGNGGRNPGNMFVPIDRLGPILGELLIAGRTVGKPRPWLGVTTSEVAGRLMVAKVTPGGPAEKAGLTRGDVILGVNGERARNLADFYRKLWAQGHAGDAIGLDIERRDGEKRIDVRSIDRLDHLKLKSTF